MSLFPAQCPPLAGGHDRFLQWGVCPDTGQAFWLRQTDMRRPLIKAPARELAVAVFQRDSRELAVMVEEEVTRKEDRRRWQREGDWENVQHIWSSGSFVRQTGLATGGRLFTARGSAHWELSTRPRDADDMPSAPLAWPAGTLRAAPAGWHGRLTVAGQSVAGHFQGAVLQHWGSVILPGLAQVSCHHFQDDAASRFTLLAQSLELAWPGRDPLGLALAELVDGDQCHRFERWLPTPTVDAQRLDRYRWMGTLVNRTHRLEVVADGGNPRVNAWMGLVDHTPEGGRRLLRVTPFASLRLRLFARGSQTLLRAWRSEHALLMTRAGDDAHVLMGRAGQVEP